MDRNRVRCPLDKAFFNLWPLIVCGASTAQVGGGMTSGCDVLTVDEHQFLASFFVEKMHETNGHHCGGELVAVGFEEAVDVLHV